MKKGGETAGEGGRQGPCGRGWMEGGLAPVGKLLSVKLVEPLDGTSFPEQLSSTFSSFTVCSTISSSSCLFSIFTFTRFAFSLGETDSSLDLVLLSWLRSPERGNPRQSWKMSNLLHGPISTNQILPREKARKLRHFWHFKPTKQNLLGFL